MRCHRCNGTMANERFYGPGEPFWGWRCVFCGEIFDPLILENREMGIPPAKNAIPGGRKGRR